MNVLKQHKLVALPVAGLMAVAFALAVMALGNVDRAEAHSSPSDCTANGGFIGIEVFRADGTTPVGGDETVQTEELIRYRTTLAALGLPFCNFDQGTLTITTPDGTVHDVTPGTGIPLVEPGSPFLSALVDYTVSEADVDGNDQLVASTLLVNARSHLGTGPHPRIDLGPAFIPVHYEDVALEVSKTADPAFDREFFWDIQKDVDPDSHTLGGDLPSGTSNYTVTVTSVRFEESNHSVSGTITITNPAEFADASIVSVDDVVNGFVADIDCQGHDFTAGPIILAPGETLICSYQADLDDDSTLTNTATVTTDGNVDGGEATAPVNFDGVDPTNEVNKAVTVIDDNVVGNLGTCDADDVSCTFPYELIFTCPEDEGEHPNTATIVETGQSADALVTVTCVSPSISIVKDPDQQTVVSGGTATFLITVLNDGNANLVNVEVTDAEAPDCDRVIGDLAAGAEVDYTCERENVTEDFTNVAVVTGLEPDTNTTVTDNDDAEVRVVDANIRIDPAEAANEVGTEHILTITVNAVGGDLGNGTATATIENGPGNFVGPDSCDYTGGAGVTSASCDVVITSNVAGTTEVSATSDIPVNGLVITRSTDGVGLNSGNAEKTWVAVRISIAPLEDENPVGSEHVLTILLEQSVEGDDWTPLAGETVDAAIVAGPGEFVGGIDSCTTDASGECQVIITSNEAGTTTVEATWAGGTVAEAEVTAKATDPDAIKEWVPPVGEEGCTPGFWRQPHHFEHWTDPYEPDTLFSDVFGHTITVGAGGRNTITDPTLHEAVEATGGGINALARHAVAALLNAASPDVEYAFTVTEVIDMVHDAIEDGSASEIERVKDLLEEANEAGCPL